MLRRFAAATALLLLATALPAAAERPYWAGGGHGRGHDRPVWVHPQYGPSYQVPQYYYAPRPPRPVYVVPPPIYYAPPPPVYYAPPPPVVVYPGWGYPQGEVSFGLRLPVR